MSHIAHIHAGHNSVSQEAGNTTDHRILMMTVRSP
jgi:hypothetical protein